MNETIQRIKEARKSGKITFFQYATLIGQCRAGDAKAALKGLGRIIRRGSNGKTV